MPSFELPAHGWRLEPDQITSPVTRRLLAWMDWVRLDAAGDIEEVGRDIAIGLAALTGAHKVAIFSRDWPSENLRALAGVRLDGGETSTAVNAATVENAWTYRDLDENMPNIEARHVLATLPDRPFWFDGAPTPAKEFIHSLTNHLHSFVASPVVSEAGLFTDAAPMLMTENVAAEITPSPNAVIDALAIDSSLLDSNDQSTLQHDLPSLIVPLRGLHQSGESPISGLALLWIQSEDGLVSSVLQAPLEAAAMQAGGWLSGALRSERLGRSYRELAEVTANAIDNRDARRVGHSGAVAYYCGLIAAGMGLPETEIELIEFAGLLHDIGKVAVPDAILQKTAPLTLEELETVRSSTISGAQWISNVEGLSAVSAIVRHQNERFDGSGFPDGLKGDEIPIGARILAVALRFAAMTKPRADRGAMSVVSGAFEVLASEAGRSLDREVVQAFLASMGRRLER
jgi:HD-GYP domain-containing protein (c-di-GMP phosphodiesterase class II)